MSARSDAEATMTLHSETSRAGSVAVVVVTFNRSHDLPKTLDAMFSQSVVPGAVIVVDNASHDGTAEMVRARYPQADLLVMPFNTGAAGGFAAGFRRAAESGYAWIWAFNDDDIPDHEALETMLAAVSSLPDRTGILGCARRNGLGGYHAIGGHWTGRVRSVPYSGSMNELVRLDVVAFSGSLVSTRLIDAIGVPRADFFMMMEELEYCLRASRGGWDVVVLPTPLVTALAMGSASSSPAWRGYYQTRNHLLLAVQQRSPSQIFWWAVRTTKLSLAGLYRPGRRERLGLRMRGAWDGFRGVTGRTLAPAVGAGADGIEPDQVCGSAS